MKKGIWFALTAVLAMTMMFAVTKHIVRGSKPRMSAFDAKNDEKEHFNSFPVDNSEREFDDWLS